MRVAGTVKCERKGLFEFAKGKGGENSLRRDIESRREDSATQGGETKMEREGRDSKNHIIIKMERRKL